MSATNFLENALLNQLVGNSTYTPGTLSLGLATAVGDAEAATGIVEVSGGAYARQSIPTAMWASPSTGTISPNVNITFPEATADWGTVTHAVIYDSNDVAILITALARTTIINTGNQYSIRPTAFTIGIN